MRVGVRLQIVLALSALLASAFVPLFLAVASLTGATLHATRSAAARALGELVAHHLAMSAPADPGTEGAWAAVLDAESRAPWVLAIGIFDERGRLLARRGESTALQSVPVELGGREQVTTIGGDPSVFRVVAPMRGALAAAAIVRPPDDRAHAMPLVRLVGLYTGMVALALLVFAYIALTRIVVRPLEALSNAARRVAAGARTFDAPVARGTVLELADLAASVSEMTATLRADEERMRTQIGELERRARELREAQDRLVRSERLASVGRLSAGLAHEIGNPIAAMMGLEDLLLAGGLEPGEERDFLRRIRAETERVHRILRDLLDFARPAASPSAAHAPGDVRSAIDDVLALVRPQRSFRNVKLESHISEELPKVVLERERIMQVVLNLLMNAADAAGPKGTVRVSAAPIDFGGNAGVAIAVEDDGPGVCPTLLPRLFEPFASTKEVGKGTGLGLAVCRGLVEAAGGKIAHDETFGPPGARFVVELPAVTQAAGPR